MLCAGTCTAVCFILCFVQIFQLDLFSGVSSYCVYSSYLADVSCCSCYVDTFQAIVHYCIIIVYLIAANHLHKCAVCSLKYVVVSSLKYTVCTCVLHNV